jgi:hypothetical protein
VTAFIAAMRAAERATNRFGDEAERAARRANVAFEQQRGGADRLERQLRRLMETQQQQNEQTRRHSEETRRNSDEQRRGSEETRRRTEETDRNTRSTDRNRRALHSAGSAMVPLVAGAVAAGAAATSAAVAFGAFGAVAAPAIFRVVSAQQDLAGNWSRLSDLERVSALQVHALTEEYKSLSRSYEPQALAALNSVISTTRGLLPQLARVVDATDQEFLDFANRLTSFVSGRVGGEFLTWAGREAPQALDVLGTTMLTAGDTSLDLVQDLAPLGIGLLQLTHGTLSALNAVAGINPLIAQFAVSALLLRAPIMGLIGGITALSARLAAYQASAAGATLATRALSAAAALSPVLWIAAGAAMLVWASKAGQTRTASERLTESLQVQHRAVGNNIDGYQALARDLLPRLEEANRRLKRAIDEKNDSDLLAVKLTGDNSSGFQKAAEDVFAYGRKTEEARTAIRNLNTTSKELAGTYNISEEAARKLATAAGVDLTKAVDKQGYLTLDAARKIDAYRVAAEAARNPSMSLAFALDDAGNEALSLSDRTKAATAALDALFNPALQAYNATTQLKQGMRELIPALSEAKGRTDGNSQASLRARAAFAQQLQSVSNLHQAIFKKTGDDKLARAEVARMLPVLYSLAGRNKDLRGLVDALARSTGNATGATATSRKAFLAAASAMGVARDKAEALWKEIRKIKDRKADIKVSATGMFTRDPGRLIPGLAAGGPVPSIGPESTERYDSVPAMLRVNEHVWTPEEVRAVGGHGAMLRMRARARRGELQGFATGGPVNFAGRGSVRGDVGAVMKPVFGGIDGMVESLSKALAAEWKKYASGGKALAWARSQAGKPYIWGGVGPAGYDCSGWTSALVNVIQGRNPHQRRHTTHSFGASSGPDGFVRNRHSAFQVGVTDAGVGHMAGTLSGVAVESSGSAGVRVGGGARGANHPMFTRQYGLRMAAGGAVSPEEARLARQALRTGASRRDVDLAASLGLIGDPSSRVSPVRPRVPAFGAGGWVTGKPGKDRNLIAATAGEFVVNRDGAQEHAALVQAINAGQVGRAFIAPTVRPSPARAMGGDGAAAAVRDVHVHVHNSGVLGSQMETENWLVKSLENAQRHGRTPWRKG